jgi:hypothetical protein
VGHFRRRYERASVTTVKLSKFETCRSSGAILVAIWALGSALPAACAADRNPLEFKQGEVNAVLRGQSQNMELFDQYFKQFFFPQFAVKADATPGPELLPKLRNELRRFRMTGKQGDAYNRLLQYTVAAMKNIAGKPTYHIAARVNAILVLGDLNDKEAVPGSKPLPAAFPLLLFVAQSDKFPDAMKVAALVGLERWARADAIPPDKKDALTKLLLEMLNQETPPPGRTLEGHGWFRRSAAQVLAAMGSPGPDNGVVAAYEKIVADPEARATLRCEMAECLGQLKYPAGAKIDYSSLANLIGHQTIEICQRELDAAKGASRQPSRRLIAYTLATALHGLEGPDSRGGLLAAAAGTDGQKFVASVRDKVKTGFASADSADVADEQIAATANDVIAELQSILLPKPEPKRDAPQPAPAAATAGNAAPVAPVRPAAAAAASRTTAGGN